MYNCSSTNISSLSQLVALKPYPPLGNGCVFLLERPVNNRHNAEQFVPHKTSEHANTASKKDVPIYRIFFHDTSYVDTQFCMYGCTDQHRLDFAFDFS